LGHSAKPTPQWPLVSVLTPWWLPGENVSSQPAWSSQWVWMSTEPGVSQAPAASMRSRAGLVMRQTSTMRPSFAAT